MKVAVIGSRGIYKVPLTEYLPDESTELVSGGAVGVDRCAKTFADISGLPIKEFLPDYKKYGRGAPLRRNIEIIDYSDLVLAFWDGRSRGTRFVIENCKKKKIPIRVFLKRTS